MTLDIKLGIDKVEAVLSGRLDTVAATQFAVDMQPLIDNADKTIVMDCTDLQFVSSSGLRNFLTIRKATIAKGGKVVIKNMIAEVKQVFVITGFNALFEFC